jgi:hypothetical protein
MGLGETLVAGVAGTCCAEDARLIWWRQTQPRASYRAILDVVPDRPNVQIPGGRCSRH